MTLSSREGHAVASYGIGVRAVQREWSFLCNTVFEKLFRDDGFFSSLDPVKRMKVATHTSDLGEYLRTLYRKGELKTNFGPVPARMVYYPPCHMREQKCVSGKGARGRIFSVAGKFF